MYGIKVGEMRFFVSSVLLVIKIANGSLLSMICSKDSTSLAETGSQIENPHKFFEWVKALQSYECRECGYDFADTTLERGRIGL